MTHTRSETCLYYKVNMWGQLPATYEPQPENEPRFIEARARNLRERFHRCGRKRTAFIPGGAFLMLKTEHLPRQARDKQRQS
jgi:hypothetical protein